MAARPVRHLVVIAYGLVLSTLGSARPVRSLSHMGGSRGSIS